MHPSVTYYQPELEAFLRHAAGDAGVELRLGVEVSSVEQTDGVTALTDTGPVRARWLVAADGASSRIRKQLGLAFVDQGYDQDWLVLDVRLRRPVPTLSHVVQQVCDPDRPTTYVVGHGDYRRWEFQLQPGETRDEMVDRARVWQLLDAGSPPTTPTCPSRGLPIPRHGRRRDARRAGLHRRRRRPSDAAVPRPGAVLGRSRRREPGVEAPPVDDGAAADRLLDTYGEERMPHAAGVVAHAVDTGRLIDELSGRAPQQTGSRRRIRGQPAVPDPATTACRSATTRPSAVSSRSRHRRATARRAARRGVRHRRRRLVGRRDLDGCAGPTSPRIVEVPTGSMPMTLPPAGP
jgi:3-(3-hydroxy-phenyl)propionate hydroxylase